MVVRHCISRGPYPLSAERELWRASALPGALLASCRGNSNAEGQYKHMAHATVLESDPHVRLYVFILLFFLFVVCLAEFSRPFTDVYYMH